MISDTALVTDGRVAGADPEVVRVVLVETCVAGERVSDPVRGTVAVI